MGQVRFLESKFQKDLMDEIREMFPGCIVIKNDPSYIQGFPDWAIFYKDRWAMLECKRAAGASVRPNQKYYVDLLNKMSFARFVYPENKEQVLDKLYRYFMS